MIDEPALDEICATAESIAREAGALLREGLDRHKAINHKSSTIDLVTEYDLASEALITERLTAAFPTHGQLGEEGVAGGATGGDAIWFVDPLDGTNNFAHGIPFFCVSLALYRGQRPLAGVVYDPNLDEMFSATNGGGAWWQRGAERRPLTVSANNALLQSIVATGFPYDRHNNAHDNLAQVALFLKRVQGLRRAGSAALDLCYVAAGRYDGYWEFKLNPWDVAAGALIVQEAGGRVSTPLGDPLLMDARLAVMASNGRIHAEMIALHRQATAPSARRND